MNNKGSAMTIVLGIAVVLGLTGAAYGMRLFNESNVAKLNLNATKAFWIAEAGIQKAAWDYDYNSCQGMRNATTHVPCTSCSSCGTGSRVYYGTLPNGFFNVSYDPVTKTYIATGNLGQAGGSVLAARKIKVLFGRDYIYGYGAYAQGLLTIANNSRVDSYNSNNGLYNPSAPNASGHVGTNGTSVNVLEIENNSIIMGSVSTGPGGTVDYAPNKVTITGEITDTNDRYLEPVTVPSTLTSLASMGVLNINGVHTLTPGSYHYNQIVLGNNGTLNILGNVKIYVSSTDYAFTTGNNLVGINIANGGSLTLYTDGKVDLGNKVTVTNSNPNKPPSSFQIFSRYTGSNGVIIDNNNEFYGTVYAPQTDVDVSNNGALYGSVVGGTVNLNNNGQLHYDEALNTQQAPWQPAVPRDWQEVFS